MISFTQFPQLAMRNKNSIQNCTEVGCYYCQKFYPSQEIKEWTDNNETAICPFCNTDSIIANLSEYKLTEEVLKQANKFWYNK